MQSIYALGGSQRPVFQDDQQEWLLFEKALVVRLDPDRGTTEVCFTHESPPEARATDKSSVLFKSGAIDGDRLYACTSTEVLIYQVPDFRRLAYISLPIFNDLHHVSLTPHGTLMLAVTGLDMVAEITQTGELLNIWGAVREKDGWRPPAEGADYRKVPTLKPYRAHLNYVFWAQGEPWVSRGDLGDAVCLSDLRRRIVLGSKECIHDGWKKDGHLYFTSVDGHLIVVDEARLTVEERIDLNAIGDTGKMGFSWCRGVLPLDERRVWVGFTRIRQTRWKEKVRWIKHLARGFPRPTSLALFDIVDRRLLQEINLEPAGMHAIFGPLPAPAAAAAAAGTSDSLELSAA